MQHSEPTANLQGQQDSISLPQQGAAVIPASQNAPHAGFRAGLESALTRDPSWLLVEEGFTLAREHEVESLFAIANGYVGNRGSLAEGSPLSAPATFVAGVFESGQGQACGHPGIVRIARLDRHSRLDRRPAAQHGAGPGADAPAHSRHAARRALARVASPRSQRPDHPSGSRFAWPRSQTGTCWCTPSSSRRRTTAARSGWKCRHRTGARASSRFRRPRSRRRGRDATRPNVLPLALRSPGTRHRGGLWRGQPVDRRRPRRAAPGRSRSNDRRITERFRDLKRRSAPSTAWTAWSRSTPRARRRIRSRRR